MSAGGGPRTPRYLDVARTLEDAIVAGEHAVGDFLPTESELCERFAVSRHTVREALRRLAESGLVTRRQGSGTQVVAATAQSGYTQSLGSIADILQYARDTRLEIETRREIVARGALARTLGCSAGRAWHALSGLRRAARGGEPICVTDIYLDPDLADVTDRIGRSGGAVHELIEAEHGVRIEEIVQSISAGVLDADQARRLGAEAGEGALRIVRRYLGTGGRLFEASVSVHPGERFTYAMRIRREGA